MLTMHAQPAHELVVFGHNDCIFVGRLHRLSCYCVVVRQLVLLRAGAFALFAADAHGRVIQQGFTHGSCSSLPSGSFVPRELCTRKTYAVLERSRGSYRVTECW